MHPAPGHQAQRAAVTGVFEADKNSDVMVSATVQPHGLVVILVAHSTIFELCQVLLQLCAQLHTRVKWRGDNFLTFTKRPRGFCGAPI